MDGTALLADHLDTRSDEIVVLWRDVVKRDVAVPDSKRLSYDEFADHIPELLDRLADRLRGLPADATTTGAKHGRMRWKQGYDVTEVVEELGHLRAALVRATFDCAREQDLDLDTLESACAVIADVLTEAGTEAVREFQETSAAETEAARAEAEQRRRALEDAWIIAEAERSKLRTLLENLPVGVWVVDAEGTVVGMNHEAERLQGFPEAGAVGVMNVLRPVPEYEVARNDGTTYDPGELPVARALRGEVVIQEVMVWPRHGSTRHVAVNAAPLLGAGGAVVGAVAVVQDVTARKRMEERHLDQVALRNTITESLAQAVVGIDADGRTTFANPAVATVFGWSPQELLGGPLHEMVHDRHADGSPYPRASARSSPSSARARPCVTATACCKI